jgi:anti-anti-sigma factor
VSDAPLLPDSIDSLTVSLPSMFARSSTNNDLDVAWLHPAKELDLATTPQLELTLGELQSQARLVVLDLREVTFIDCSGVHAIVNATIRARQIGRRVVLLSPQPNINRVFTLTESSDEVEICDIDPALVTIDEYESPEAAAEILSDTATLDAMRAGLGELARNETGEFDNLRRELAE